MIVTDLVFLVGAIQCSNNLQLLKLGNIGGNIVPKFGNIGGNMVSKLGNIGGNMVL